MAHLFLCITLGDSCRALGNISVGVHLYIGNVKKTN